ncbi:hypothetical protein CALVIDRAFT_548644 [Calocera viscosa TUFC12733]|uniref:Amino acid permease/ SLC12A domain-containing protein n=1 Tax=Calocera viscosa (strain TUFC12733) TaxID=1330018 RepID=A0A167Q134_CALVF|nr:hypothetical protein CALVIDRAFT_548644 [Calocera viscosa TUFC12733]
MQLHRQLKARHIAMISIGGVIGTGLFVGTANSLASGGPVGLWLGYIVMGSITYSVMQCLGEMIAWFPVPGGHITLADRFVDPALSFAMGWNYLYNWVITLPVELSAAAVLVGFWDHATNPAVYITVCLVVVVAINACGAGVYGECEFWFASIKVITITGLIILGIILAAGGGPDHDRIGFRYWANPGPFAQYNGIPGTTGRFLAWWSVMTQAAFSFIGTEVVAIAAGEAKNPRKNIPKAIKRVYIRICIFYIAGTFIISLLVPYTNPSLGLKTSTAAKSPFVIAIQTAGINGLPSVVNAALLTSAWSAGSSDLYSSSRALYGMALIGNAPRIFARTTRNGLPWVAVATCSLSGLLAYLGTGNITAGTVFTYLSNMTAIAGLITWFGIGITYLRFHAGMKRQGIPRSVLPFKSWPQPFLGWYVVISTWVICFFSGYSVFLTGGWDTGTFITNYAPFILFPILYISYKLASRCHTWSTSEMDFKSGGDLYPLEEDSPKNLMQKFWGWLKFGQQSHQSQYAPEKWDGENV